MAHGKLEAVQEVDNILEKVTVYPGKNFGPWRAGRTNIIFFFFFFLKKEIYSKKL